MKGALPFPILPPGWSNPTGALSNSRNTIPAPATRVRPGRGGVKEVGLYFINTIFLTLEKLPACSR